MAGKFSQMLRSIARTISRKQQPSADQTHQTHPTGSTSPSSAAASRDSALAGVTVQYNPNLDGDPDPGEVVWTWVPWQEDPSQGKDRPVVIIGRRGPTMLVGVPLTSKVHDNERQVSVGMGSWDQGGRTSYAKLDRILDVDPSKVRREGAILDRSHFDQIVHALRN
jgi:mRNA-degrading endonuclease toxin of MazEF toxin-antitoxin module